jgi:hypothetical protein
MNFYPYCPHFLTSFVNIWFNKFAHNAVERVPVAGAVFQLSSCLLHFLSPFPYATEVFFMPAFHFGIDSVFGRRSVRLFFEILISAWSSKTCFIFSNCGPGSWRCCPEFGVVCDQLIEFWQRHATVLLSFLRAWSHLDFARVYSYCA